jgi:hypothetical protein
MGTPTSGLIAQFFLQNLGTPKISAPFKHKFTSYFRYVDILLVYNHSHTDIQSILDDFNTVHPNLKFTAETETSNKIKYLDITIHRTPRAGILPYTANPPSHIRSSCTPPTTQPNTSKPP